LPSIFQPLNGTGDAEIDAAQMKKLEFFQRQLDQCNPQIFSRPPIVDVRNYFGLMVELPDALITGPCPCGRRLTDDFLFV